MKKSVALSLLLLIISQSGAAEAGVFPCMPMWSGLPCAAIGRLYRKERIGMIK